MNIARHRRHIAENRVALLVLAWRGERRQRRGKRVREEPLRVAGIEALLL